MRILIVEDHPSIRSNVARALRDANFVIDEATDGLDGLGKAFDTDYDAIILDVMLPGIDGWELLERLRTSKTTPVLMLTARDAVDDRIRGLNSGADDYLTKPFEMGELEARLRALIRRSSGEPNPLIYLGDYCLDLNSRLSGLRALLNGVRHIA
ncbi:MAG: response regulator [Verrucomicrobiota bacterium]